MEKETDKEVVAGFSDSSYKKVDEVIKETQIFLESVKTDPLGHILEGLDMAKKKKAIKSRAKIIK